MTITVKYSCRDCRLHRVTVSVPARDSEDVADWMKATVRLVSADHARRSPACHPKALSELLIPMDGTQKIGGPAVN